MQGTDSGEQEKPAGAGAGGAALPWAHWKEGPCNAALSWALWVSGLLVRGWG